MKRKFFAPLMGAVVLGLCWLMRRRWLYKSLWGVIVILVSVHVVYMLVQQGV